MLQSSECLFRKQKQRRRIKHVKDSSDEGTDVEKNSTRKQIRKVINSFWICSFVLDPLDGF